MGIRILVVDDDENLREIIRQYLENQGHRVTGVANGHEAIRSLWPTVQLLITDLEMPEGNGHDLIEFMRGNWPEVAIIAMSGRDPKPLPHGVVFLPKPFGLDTLDAAIAEAHPHIHTGCGCQPVHP